MTDEARMQMGLHGRQLVEKQFTWDIAAKKMLQLYSWILNGGEKPEFVYL
jgi:glycosyltransferase involved in cell wall biosynthesis